MVGGGYPSQIGEYRVIRLLGRGGMGEVYLVEHPRLPRRDALKLLDAAVSRNKEFRSRFTREADLLASMRHPNIITIYDRGEFEGRLWLTMEYIDGQDASTLLRAPDPPPRDLAVRIIAAAGAALDYAYTEHRITHRDVKPANILLEFGQGDELRTAKLADFGIAKAVGESTSLTSTGVTIGTITYMSPEAIEGHDLDNRADIYSLGLAGSTGSQDFVTGSLFMSDKRAAARESAIFTHLVSPLPARVDRDLVAVRELVGNL